MMGFAFSNHANGGVIGNGPFFCLGVNTDGLLRFVFQFSYAITSSTIVQGCTQERLHIGTYIAFCFIMCCVIYPVPASWVWGGGWLQEIGFVDYAGASVVAVTGGFSGFSGSYCVGPRVNIFDEDEDFKKSKKKLQMLSKESESKDSRQKRFREKQLKVRREGKQEQDKTKSRHVKKIKEIMSNDTKKGFDKKPDSSKHPNPEESFESDNNMTDQVRMTKSKTRQRKAFYLSSGMQIKDRIIIFKQDFPEFTSLDDE